MPCTIHPGRWDAVRPLRERYRREMSCQIVRDSLHGRAGWVEWFIVRAGDAAVGYAAVVVAGPWAGTRSLFEVYLEPAYRPALLSVAGDLLHAAGVDQVLVQTNDRCLDVILHQLCRDARPESVVFEAGCSTTLPGGGAVFRAMQERERGQVFAHGLEPVGDWVLELGSEIVATGGYLTHYNPPFVDVYMEVRPDMRRRGLGAYLVQEIKRVAQAAGVVPCGRASADNTASLRTMARAGMVPCAHLVVAKPR